MGSGIAAVFAACGYRVSLYSRSEATLERARANIAAVTDAAVTLTTSLEDCLHNAAVVSENLAEDIALKQWAFGEFERFVSDDCLLTTNTSSVPITAIAHDLKTPERVIGIHWFNPATVMPLVEIVRGARTCDATVERARALCLSIDRQTIEVNRDIEGFVINRLQYAILREALHLVETGVVSVEDVDKAVETTLAPRWSAAGPLKLMDFAGLDVVEKVSKIVMPALDRSGEIPPLVSRLCKEGALGTKAGRGFYDWTADGIEKALDHRNSTIRLLTERTQP